MSDPFEKMRQFLTDNAASLELAQLRMEQNRRKGIKRRHIGGYIGRTVKSWDGYIEFAIADRLARLKKANAD